MGHAEALARNPAARREAVRRGVGLMVKELDLGRRRWRPAAPNVEVMLGGLGGIRRRRATGGGGQVDSEAERRGGGGSTSTAGGRWCWRGRTKRGSRCGGVVRRGRSLTCCLARKKLVAREEEDRRRGRALPLWHDGSRHRGPLYYAQGINITNNLSYSVSN
jgi:hypothetical protein